METRHQLIVLTGLLPRTSDLRGASRKWQGLVMEQILVGNVGVCKTQQWSLLRLLSPVGASWVELLPRSHVSKPVWPCLVSGHLRCMAACTSYDWNVTEGTRPQHWAASCLTRHSNSSVLLNQHAFCSISQHVCGCTDNPDHPLYRLQDTQKDALFKICFRCRKSLPPHTCIHFRFKLES